MHATAALAVFLMCCAVAVVLAVRAIMQRTYRGTGTGTVDTVMEPLAGIYGLLLAFLVGTVADRGFELRGAMLEEAEAYHRMDQIAGRLPMPLGTELRRSLQMYRSAELAARAEQEKGQRSTTILNDMWLSVATFEPRRPRENILQSEALAELRILRDQREGAARANQFAYGPLIWLVLGIGTVSVLGVCLIAGLADPRGAVYLAALTATIAITLYVFYALSRPLVTTSFRTMTELTTN